MWAAVRDRITAGSRRDRNPRTQCAAAARTRGSCDSKSRAPAGNRHFRERATAFSRRPHASRSLAQSEGKIPDLGPPARFHRRRDRYLALRARHGSSGRPIAGTLHSSWMAISRRWRITGERPELVANGPFRDGAWSVQRHDSAWAGRSAGPSSACRNWAASRLPETTLDTSRRERSPTTIPNSCPDGRHYIYMSRRGIQSNEFKAYVGTVGAKERRPLPGISSRRQVLALRPSVVSSRQSRLVAQPFNPDRLELSGDAVSDR